MFDQFIDLEEKPYDEEDAEWDNFVTGHPNGSILQTANWARLKNRFGWHSRRVWLKREGRLVAGAQILIRSAALGLLRVGYIPHGPLVNWSDDEQIDVLFNQIDHALYKERVGLVKFEPMVWQNEIDPVTWHDLCQRHNCLSNSDTIQPPRTVLIDLQATEDEILGRMKQKTRYNIRLAAKKGVTVRQGTVEDVPIFVRLIQVTGERNVFGIHEPEYYQRAYELFAPANGALLIAEYDKQPLSAVMVFKCGAKAFYLFGASGNSERQRMPNYAAQWAAILWAKESGCTTYDLWGVPDHPADELEANFQSHQDGLWGVYRFKRGFGGDLQRTVGTSDRVYNNWVYKLYKWRRGR
jgi:lipid II:glycine glycyltransferase (peptidoglycan interpeptide bridge formation enzyme)